MVTGSAAGKAVGTTRASNPKMVLMSLIQISWDSLVVTFMGAFLQEFEVEAGADAGRCDRFSLDVHGLYLDERL